MSITGFSMSFLYLLDKVNGSNCYVVYDNKPNYGPYNGPKSALEVSFF